DPQHLEQLRVTARKLGTRIKSLEQQEAAIALTLEELRRGARTVRDLIRQREQEAAAPRGKRRQA
ncbi:MAG: hypothetical protein ACREFD_08420, partial [Stellaceae bacterium]